MDFVAKKLNWAKENGTYRELPLFESKIDFYSNDYLGFGKSNKTNFLVKELMKNFPEKDMPGSRLISGNSSIKSSFEAFLAQIHLMEGALLFNSGYAANTGFWSSIMEKDVTIFFDEYVHASIRDGLRLCAADKVKFKHNDFDDLKNHFLRKGTDPSKCFLAIESLYSMDGDQPNWQALKNFLDEFPMCLVIDEAHSTGTFGNQGVGLLQQNNMAEYGKVRIHTFGKGIGNHGAVILADEDWIDYLINFSRPFIYTTALPNESIARSWVSYLRLMDEPLQNELFDNIAYYINLVQKLNLEQYFSINQSPIQTFHISNPELLKEVEQALRSEGIGVKAIYSPTVPLGKERMRITLHAQNTTKEIELLFDIVRQII